AMALDPNLAEAHAATGHVLLIQGNFEEALTHFEQAIQLNPNYSIVYTWLGIGSIFMGHYDESFAAHEKGLRLDPLSLPTHHNYVGGLIARNRLAEADREIEKFASISPSLYATMRGRLASVGGKWAYAVLGDLEAFRIDPERVRRTVLSWYFAAIGLEKEALAISESPGPLALRMLGKPDDAVTVAEARVADEPDSLWNRHDLGLALASAGDYARARPILEEMWQRSGGRITSMYRGLLRTDSAAALIVIRRDAGKEAEVGELVAAIRDNVRRYREAGLIRGGALWGIDYEEGFAAYLSGERERGLALIARGVEDGAFIPQREAYLQVLYDDPGFAPIRKMQETRQARERERFLTIVCTDNPYAAVWQPAEGTCERFATGVKN
ncbi:MAG: tetratricopeptide repeat protein, partial [Gammaproteobacteria bacterium]|nr:tetratricopeptide repeat protein [Gammaproteobacteria bacterium]